MDANRHTSAADFTVDFFLVDRALHTDGMAQVDGTGAGVGVEIERRVLGEAELNAARSGVDDPASGGLALGLDVAAASLGLQRAANAAQVESAGAGLSADRAGARFSCEVAGEIPGKDKIAANLA